MWAPKLESHEALSLEFSHFAECIMQGHEPLTNGHSGLEVSKYWSRRRNPWKKTGLQLKSTRVQRHFQAVFFDRKL